MKKIVAAALLIGLLSLLPISAPAAQAGGAAEAVLPVQVRLAVSPGARALPSRWNRWIRMLPCRTAPN